MFQLLKFGSAGVPYQQKIFVVNSPEKDYINTLTNTILGVKASISIHDKLNCV